MVDVARPLAGGRRHERKAGEPLQVACGKRAPAFVHRVQSPEQHAQRRGLQLIEPQIEADFSVDVLLEPAVVAEPAAPQRDVVVAGENGASIPHRRKVFRRIK